MKIYNSKYKIITLLFCLLGFYTQTSAQISSGGEPISFKQNTNLSRVNQIPQVTTSSIDKTRLLQEDQELNIPGKPFKIAQGIKVDYDFLKLALCEDLPNGDQVCRLKIKSPDALQMAVHFDKFNLPKGTKLFIYNEDRSNLLGAFTNLNNKKSGSLPTSFLVGDALVIEYYSPANTSGGVQLHIDNIANSYNDQTSPFTSEQSFGFYGNSAYVGCLNDVNCPQGDDWQTEKRSVVGICYYDDGEGVYYGCTGALINNTAQDWKPIILNANHCIRSQAMAESAIFYFNYESPSCDGPTGTLLQTVASADYLMSYVDSDISLLEMTAKPPTSYNAYYAGWDRSDNPATNSAGIHHAASDVKKIGLDSDPAYSEGAFCWSSTGDCFPSDSHWRIFFDDTRTVNGSSGSPLFNQNHQIVGQLHGGGVTCPNDPLIVGGNISRYGKLSYSWENSNVSQFLDPLNTEATSMPGSFRNEVCQSHIDVFQTYPNESDSYVTANSYIDANNTIESGARVVYDAGDYILFNEGVSIEYGSVFCGLIEGCEGQDPLTMYPWLDDIINNGDCCNEIIVTIWPDATFEPADLNYVYVEYGPNCDMQFNQLYLNGLAIAGGTLDTENGVNYYYSDQSSVCQYPWVNDIVNNNCCSGTSFDLYNYNDGTFDFELIYVDYGPSCSGDNGLYYISTGISWCLDSPTYDCSTDPSFITFQRNLYTVGACKTANSSHLLAEDQKFETNINIYPNPAENFTIVDFYLEKEGNVSISLFDIQGKEIKQIVNNEIYQEGSNQIALDCSDIVAGTYFCSILINDKMYNEKLIILE